MKLVKPTVAILLILALLLSACGGSTPPAANQTSAGDQTSAAPAPGLISPEEYQAYFVNAAHKHLLIDVRTSEEYASGKIPGALNIPIQELAQRMAEVPKDQPVIVYCQSGNRSNQANQLLTEAGYTQIFDLGGIRQWQAAGMQVEQ